MANAARFGHWHKMFDAVSICITLDHRTEQYVIADIILQKGNILLKGRFIEFNIGGVKRVSHSCDTVSLIICINIWIPVAINSSGKSYVSECSAGCSSPLPSPNNAPGMFFVK